MNNFALMARFNAWVNERIYEAVAELSEADYRQDRKLYFGSIHNTLNHLFIVDRLWTARLEGVDHGIRSLDQILYDSFDALRLARRVEDQRIIGLIDGLSEQQLTARVTYKRMLGGGTHVTRRDHMLLTLYNHQTHHRGQVHAALTQADIDPPAVDVIDYYEEVGLS